MSLKIAAVWGGPLALSLKGDGPIYSCDVESIPEKAGVYIFSRRHGKTSSPLYIGQSTNLRKRIKQHLNSAKLMMAIKNTYSGGKFLIYCEIKFKKGQNHKSVLDVLENALIAHALAEGNELLQIQGTRFPSHEITFTGVRVTDQIAPRSIRYRAS